MLVGIKYCGGCNPKYDRVSYVENLKKELTGNIYIRQAKPGILYDSVIAVCGCETRCASISGLLSRNGFIYIVDTESFCMTYSLLEELSKDEI